MAALAVHFDGKRIGRCRRRPSGNANHTHRHHTDDVLAKQHIHAVQRALLHQRFRAFDDFLCGLKQQPHRAGQLALHTAQRFGRAVQHGGVGIVAAGMHDARHGRSKRQIGVLGHRQRVDVGPQAHHFAGFATLDVGHQAGGRKPGHSEAQPL